MRAALRAGIEGSRRAQEEKVLNGVYGVRECAGVEEARRVENLRQAVSASIDYGLAAIDDAPVGAGPEIPEAVLRHARAAARIGVGHETVISCYCAANLLFVEVLIDVADKVGAGRGDQMRLLAVGRCNFELLLAAISEAYVGEELAPLYRELERRGEGG